MRTPTWYHGPSNTWLDQAGQPLSPCSSTVGDPSQSPGPRMTAGVGAPYQPQPSSPTAANSQGRGTWGGQYSTAPLTYVPQPNHDTGGQNAPINLLQCACENHGGVMGTGNISTSGRLPNGVPALIGGNCADGARLLIDTQSAQITTLSGSAKPPCSTWGTWTAYDSAGGYRGRGVSGASVLAGDTTSSLASRYRTTPHALVAANPERPAALYQGIPAFTSLAEGDVLRLPSNLG